MKFDCSGDFRFVRCDTLYDVMRHSSTVVIADVRNDYYYEKCIELRRRVAGAPHLYLQRHCFKFRSGIQLFFLKIIVDLPFAQVPQKSVGLFSRVTESLLTFPTEEFAIRSIVRL